jgi:PAS domain S-box-containing protein
MAGGARSGSVQAASLSSESMQDQRLHDLIAVNRAITGSLDYDEVLRLIVDKTATFIQADACALLLLAGADNMAHIVASRGIDEDRTRQFAAAFDERLGEVLRPLFDFREHDVFVGAPVMIRQRVSGALVVFRRGPQAPDPEESMLVKALADQAAIALEHAGAYREVRQMSERKSRLLEAIESNTTTYLAYLDCELRLLEINAAYCNAIGIAVADAVGRRYAEIHPDEETTRALLERTCATGVPTELQETPLAIRRAGLVTETVYWDWSARPVTAERGQLNGVVISAVDVTQKVLTRNALEAANKRKDEFLAMLAHELRNPLAAIATAVEVLRMCGSDDPRKRNSIDAAARQASHMKRLLDDLLDVSRITSGNIELRRETIDLAEVIAQAVQLTTPLIRSRRQQFSIELAPEPLFVNGDSDRLVQIISNLLTNAAKYTPVGGRIRLEVHRLNGEIAISVSDNGTGISPEALPHIFDLFVQADRALDRTDGGLGIGLTIVRRLVDMHGGRIEARSAGLGQGSEFVIGLPAVEAPRSSSPPPVVPSTNPSAGLDVLVAEDNADVAQMLTAILEIDGHRVTVVGDGMAAVEVAERDRPDVVLLDIGLPHSSGYEVANRLRESMQQDAPMLVALTGYGRAEDRARALAAGIDHHLVKPVDVAQLRRILAARTK